MNFDPRLGSLVATALPSGFAMALLCIRVQRTHTMTFTFLAWNLVLAWIAYALGESTIALGRRLVVLYFAYVVVPRAWITGVSGGGGEPLERT